MFCPSILGAGLYLVKVIYDIINLCFIKILLICIGVLGTIFSMLFSVLQNNLNYSSFSSFNQIGIFDIDFILCSNKYNTKLKITIGGIIRLITNIILPGSGVLSLLCKYGCNIGIFIIGIIELGNELLLLIIVLDLYNQSIEHYIVNNKEGILVSFGYQFFYYKFVFVEI
jgi:hypothetical protein